MFAGLTGQRPVQPRPDTIVEIVRARSGTAVALLELQSMLRERALKLDDGAAPFA
jgi:hypothetical protein